MHTRVEIRTAALKANVASFRRACGTAVMAVLKSNAYGHGLTLCAKALSGHADWFGVNSISEALAIRAVDERTPILVMGMNDASDYSLLRGLQRPPVLVLSTVDSIRELNDRLPSHPFHLKVDTGMSRLGLHGAAFEQVIEFLSRNPALQWQGLMTHFANVEDVTDQTFAQEQLRRFDDAARLAAAAAGSRRLMYHTAASGAAMLLPGARRDLIRAGISLYGMWPSRETRISAASLSAQGKFDSSFALEPALEWKTQIVHVNDVPAGQAIGYGCTYRPVTNTRVAVLPVGYNEGYDRRLSNKAHAIIEGQRSPVIGRVCMNMIMTDISHIPSAHTGSDAILIGRQGTESVTADDLADWMGTINYEVTTKIEPGIPRIALTA